MGKSAKLGRKRPTRSEKAAKVINNQTVPKYARADDQDEAVHQSAIPLFNTSAKGRLQATQQRLARLRGDIMSLDSSAAPSPRAVSPSPINVDDDDDDNAANDTSSVVPETELSFDKKGKKHKSLKDKVKAAKLNIKSHSNDGKVKEGALQKRRVLGDVDYLKLHEKRPGGMWTKKKLR